MGDTATDVVPIGNVWFNTTTGGLDGIVGNPICQYHTSDGNDYSDFVQVSLVTVDGATYEANTYKSVGDVVDNNAETTDTGILVNMPVVPIGSTLQDPNDKTTIAPIDPVTCWYKGVKIQTCTCPLPRMICFRIGCCDDSSQSFGTTNNDCKLSVINFLFVFAQLCLRRPMLMWLHC